MLSFREFRSRLCLVLAVECLLCCAIFAQHVDTIYTPGFNFSKYHTYRWVQVQGQHPDATVDAQIKQSFDSQLAARGLKKADAAADLNVDYQVAIRKQEKWQVYEDWTQTDLMDQRLPHRKLVIIPVGTLSIDIYDAAEKKLVWTGRADKVLDPSSSPEDRQRNLDKATEKLLREFPPN